jgi:hypothetical protein
MGRYAQAAKKAAELTNIELGKEIAGFSPVNADRIKELFPTKAEKEAFLELMKVVEAETSNDEKIAHVTQNIGKLGRIIVKALRVFV